MQLLVEKLNLDIFTHAPPGKSFLSGSYHHPQAKGNYLSLQVALF